MRRHLMTLGLAAWLVIGCFASPATSPAPGPASHDASSAPTGSASPRPIIIDADLDHSDIAAILVLLRDPAVDVRAIAITGTGLVHCQGGRLVTRYLLDEMGVPDIPFGCGRRDGGPDAHPFPEDWRVVADTGYGLDITPKAEIGVPRDAVEVLTAAIETSPTPPLLVTVGPWTNLEDAFAADPTLVDRVAGIHAMLGTIDAPGNVFLDGFDGSDPLEWNAFADPSAVTAVFATDLPIALIPLDGTDDVPVPGDLAERLVDDHAAAGADLMYELLVRNPSRMAQDQGQQLWDELAALAVSGPDLVSWEAAIVSAGIDGRVTRDPIGRPVRFASTADRPAVEAGLLAGLRRGGPRLTPFAIVGETTAVWDGTTCALTPVPTRRGMHTLRLENTSGAPGGVTIVGLVPPHDWADLAAVLSAVDFDDPATAQPPAWIQDVGSINDETGNGVDVSVLVDIGEGLTGPVCVAGTWPDLRFVPGAPFDAGIDTT